ncbi:hypothetical protein ASPCADRAFT_207338 [Aspergillus carbonarius ITEM 5010]|uniref:Uncharacterized protein n=1 Tax=Aspergillus carbonarius (strain ITEM 5010) TaxID=602072 RepID=A0A1R3RND3_ASPC5|nr:hypothetical protein ASPCADRAFT_207338 [Aspergillus carbonarius ITEM 5010]
MIGAGLAGSMMQDRLLLKSNHSPPWLVGGLPPETASLVHLPSPKYLICNLLGRFERF